MNMSLGNRKANGKVWKEAKELPWLGH